MKLENIELTFDNFSREMEKLYKEKHFDYLVTIVGEDFGEEGEEDGLQLLHADAEGLGDEDVVEAVHGQAGELVGLAEDDPAGREVGRFEDSLAVGPGVLDAAAPEAGVEGVVGVAGDEADADLALERDEAGAKVSALRAHHVGEGSVLRLCLRELEDVVLVHPRMPAHEAGFGFFCLLYK